MTREKIRVIGMILLLLGGFLFIIGLGLSSTWLAISGGVMALASIFLFIAIGIIAVGKRVGTAHRSAQRALQEARERISKEHRGPKQLRIEEQTFGSNKHILIQLFVVLLCASPVVCLLVLMFDIFSLVFIYLLFILFSLLFIGLRFLVYQTMNTKIIINQMEIRSEAPFKRTRVMKWQDLVSLRKVNGGETGDYYSLYSIDSEIDFAENLTDAKRLLACIHAAMEGVPDSDGMISVNLPARDKYTSTTVSLAFIGGFLAIIGGIITYFSIGEWQRLQQPIVPLDKASQAGEGKSIRIVGLLNAEMPVRSRDGAETYAFEQIKVTRTESDDNTRTYYWGWVPTAVWVTDGNNKLLLRTKEIYERFVPKFEDRLDSDWESTKTGKRIAHTFDKDLKQYIAQDDRFSVTVWTIDQGAKVSVIGKIQMENDQPVLVSDGAYLWISTRTQSDIIIHEYLYVFSGAGLLLMGIVYCVAAYLDMWKRKSEVEGSSPWPG